MNNVIVLLLQMHQTGTAATTGAKFCTCFFKSCHINPLLMAAHTYRSRAMKTPQTTAVMGRGRRLHVAELNLTLATKCFSRPAELLHKKTNTHLGTTVVK